MASFSSMHHDIIISICAYLSYFDLEQLAQTWHKKVTLYCLRLLSRHPLRNFALNDRRMLPLFDLADSAENNVEKLFQRCEDALHTYTYSAPRNNATPVKRLEVLEYFLVHDNLRWLDSRRPKGDIKLGEFSNCWRGADEALCAEICPVRDRLASLDVGLPESFVSFVTNMTMRNLVSPVLRGYPSQTTGFRTGCGITKIVSNSDVNEQRPNQIPKHRLVNGYLCLFYSDKSHFYYFYLHKRPNRRQGFYTSYCVVRSTINIPVVLGNARSTRSKFHDKLHPFEAIRGEERDAEKSQLMRSLEECFLEYINIEKDLPVLSDLSGGGKMLELYATSFEEFLVRIYHRALVRACLDKPSLKLPDTLRRFLIRVYSDKGRTLGPKDPE